MYHRYCKPLAARMYSAVCHTHFFWNMSQGRCQKSKWTRCQVKGQITRWSMWQNICENICRDILQILSDRKHSIKIKKTWHKMPQVTTDNGFKYVRRSKLPEYISETMGSRNAKLEICLFPCPFYTYITSLWVGIPQYIKYISIFCRSASRLFLLLG